MFMRQKTVHIAIDVNSGVRGALKVHHNTSRYFQKLGASVFLLFALITTLFLSGAFQSRANTSFLYPSVCLGGWENTYLAEGAPDTLTEAPFTRLNGAMLRPDALAQIYCGRFSGEILPDTIPRSVTIRLAIGSEEEQHVSSSGAVLEAEPTVFERIPEGDGASSSGGTLPSEPSDESLSETVVPDDVEQETPVETAPEPVSEPTPTPELAPELTPPPESAPEPIPEPTSWFRRLINVAYAAEETPPEKVPEVVVEEVPSEIVVENSIPEAVVEKIPESKELFVEEVVSEPVVEVLPEPESAILEELLSEESIVPPSEGEVLGASTQFLNTEPFLEVVLTIPGKEPQVLDVLSENDFAEAAYTIDLPEGYTWSEIVHMEVAINRVPSVSTQKPVILDGVVLEVAYDVIPKEDDSNVSGEEGAGGGEGETQTIIPFGGEFPYEDIGTTTEGGFVEYIAPPNTISFHAFNREVVFDSEAEHRCFIEPSRFELSTNYTTHSGEIVLEREPGPFTDVLEVGNLPLGVDIIFADSQSYRVEVPAGTTRIPISVSQIPDSQKGSFYASFIYTRYGVGVESSTYCQIGIITIPQEQ